MGRPVSIIFRRTATWTGLAALLLGLVPRLATAAPTPPTPAPRALAAASARSLHKPAPEIETSPTRGARALAPARAQAAATLGGSWRFLGPQPITGLYNNSSGRVTALAVDPTNSSIVYAGTAGGGVWKTTDAGGTWSPLTDTQASLAIGALAIDPNNHLVVYAGTGEANRCGDCQYSQGILKTTDGGASWTLLGQNVFASRYIQTASIAVNRANSAQVFVGTNIGLFFSPDGGNSWGLIGSLAALSSGSTAYPRVDGIYQDPSTPTVYWAAVSDRCAGPGYIAVSKDGGSSWAVSVRPSDLSPSFPRAARIALAVGTGGVVYGGVAGCRNSALGTSYGQFMAIVKTVDYGNHWSAISSATGLTDYFSDTGGSQGWYDDAAAVDPTNNNRAIFGGITALVTRDGGATFTDVAKPYSGGPVHADFHAFAFTGANSLYAGNDGGVWRTSNLGGTGTASDWTNLNATLAVTTFYQGSAIDLTHMIGGSQDDGTVGALAGYGPSPPAWPLLLGGDGGWTALDPGSNVMYTERPYGSIYRGDRSNPTSWTYAAPCQFVTDPACPEPAAFVAPFVVDPTNSMRLYTGTNRVYRSSSGGIPAGTPGWTAISGDLTTGSSILADGDFITAMAISADGSTVATGSFGGKVFLTRNATQPSPTWTEIDTTLPAFSFSSYTGNPWITSITFSTTLTSELWVAFGVYPGAVGQLFHSTTSGATWAGISFSTPGGSPLPPTVVHTLAPVPGAGFALYAGTDNGAYVCTACGGTDPRAQGVWFALGSGLPNVQVDGINSTADGSSVLVWTHGRGAWALDRPAFVPALTISPGSFAFGNQTVNTDAFALITFGNPGTAPLHTTSIGFSGPDASQFSLQGSNCDQPNGVIQTGQLCYDYINFYPTSAGAKSASLVINYDAAGSPQSIPVSGTGVVPVVSLSPSGLSFPDTPVATASAPLSVTVTNTGSGALYFRSQPQLQGANPADFAIQSLSCGSGGPGIQCSVSVQFTPTSVGPKSATVVLTDNAADSPQSFPVSGTGVLTNVGLSPTALAFPDTVVNRTSPGPLAVTVTANGPGNLVLHCGQITFSGANPSDFAQFSNPQNPPCTQDVYLFPGASTSIRVVFKPTGAGARSAVLNLPDNANGSPQAIQLSGNGLPSALTELPTSIDFGSQRVGTTSASITATVTHSSGSGVVQIVDLGTSGNPNMFSVAHQNCIGTALAVGQSCQVQVQFAPSYFGAYSGTLFIYSNSPDGPETVSLTGLGIGGYAQFPRFPDPEDFGSLYLGAFGPTHSLALTNTGNADMHISSTSLSGANPADWAIVSDGCTGATVPAGMDCLIGLQFRPTGANSRYALLVVSGDWAGGGTAWKNLSGYALQTFSCASPSLAGSPPGPQAPGTVVNLVAQTSACAVPEYRFFEKPPGSNTWNVVQEYSRSSSFSWSTSGQPPGTYGFAVWVREEGFPTPYESYTSFYYTLAIPTCASVALTTSPASPQPAGAQETVSGSASGCPQPEYRFFLQSPAGSSWQMTRDYTTGSWIWDTTGLAQGTYGLAVWARQQGSSASYETYSSTSFTIPVCGSAGVSSGAPTQPQSPSTLVIFTGSATGCAQPLYRYWIRAPGSSSWTIARDYSASRVFYWNTTGLPVGTYGIALWVKEDVSPSPYEAYASTSYTLSLLPCTGVSLSADPAPPELPGTIETVIGSATGCAQPEYRFFLQSPGSGTWQMTRDYTPTSWTWDTSNLSLGTYGLAVWARVQGSTAPYEAYVSTQFTLGAQTCAAVYLNSNSPSPQSPGIIVTFTALALGCSQPTYRFWVQNAGSSNWTMVQDYSSSNTFTWTTTYLPTGTYQIAVWARNQGAGADWETYTTMPFTLRF